MASRTTCVDDARVVMVSATDSGRARARTIDQLRRLTLSTMLCTFDETEREEFASYLERFVELCERFIFFVGCKKLLAIAGKLVYVCAAILKIVRVVGIKISGDCECFFKPASFSQHRRFLQLKVPVVRVVVQSLVCIEQRRVEIFVSSIQVNYIVKSVSILRLFFQY